MAGTAMGVLLAVLTGCGPATTGAQHSARGVATTASPTIAASPSVIGPTADLLSFTYHRHAAGTETIDQQLEIHNSYPHSVLPVLEFTAVDAHGQVMPQVKVASVYGSDRGVWWRRTATPSTSCAFPDKVSTRSPTCG